MNYEQTNEVDSLESSKLTFEELLELDEKRTQGEWKLDYYSVLDGNGFEVADVCLTFSAVANGKFIAAAPEMMKLLKKYREALESIVDMSHMDYETCASKARRALDD